MRFRRSGPTRCARTTRSCSSFTLNRPLGNFSNSVPVTSIASSLLINLQKGGPGPSPVTPARDLSSHRDVGRLQTLRAFGHFKLHAAALIQRLVSGILNRREMHEDVFSVLTLDKTEALGRVEPLHRTFFFHLPIVPW